MSTDTLELTARAVALDLSCKLNPDMNEPIIVMDDESWQRSYKIRDTVWLDLKPPTIFLYINNGQIFRITVKELIDGQI